jgi:hypothetical protein
MSKFYASGTYSLHFLDGLTKQDWFALTQRERADIRLALSQSIPYAKGNEKTKLFAIRSKLIEYSMAGSK